MIGSFKVLRLAVVITSLASPVFAKPLPGNWILGQVSGIAVDRNDHIWIVHRPSTLFDDEKGATKNPPETKCCTAAPPVLEFDQDGNLLRYWGGPGAGYDWPKSEHGIHIDSQGNVWLAGNDILLEVRQCSGSHALAAFAPA